MHLQEIVLLLQLPHPLVVLPLEQHMEWATILMALAGLLAPPVVRAGVMGAQALAAVWVLAMVAMVVWALVATVVVAAKVAKVVVVEVSDGN